jgi:FkbM family methyltransferase
MDDPIPRRAFVIHPRWNGVLRLSEIDRSLIHETFGTKGTFELSGSTLTVFWEQSEAETFLYIQGIFLHESLMSLIPDIERLFAVSIGGKVLGASKISVLVPDGNYEVALRLGTSDIPTFNQVFVRSDYASPHLPETAETIVDLGANIGLATIFFGTRYPKARILSVEPEAANFAALVANTAALGDRVQTRRAAVWMRDGFVSLRTEDDEGLPLGAWGVRVADETDQPEANIACDKLTTLLNNAGFGEVDILKVDIEGAELELFSDAASEWLPRTKLIIVETHDRFRSGTKAAVLNAVLSTFEELPMSGENLIFRRK